eukprot:7479442-Pyramimonas_sp.AAC.2
MGRNEGGEARRVGRVAPRTHECRSADTVMEDLDSAVKVRKRMEEVFKSTNESVAVAIQVPNLYLVFKSEENGAALLRRG